MNSPSTDIKDILEAYGDSSGLDVEFADNLFINREPAKPDNCITIFDTGGMPSYLGLTDTGLEYPSIQIRVRNRKQQDGWTIIEGIKTALHGRAQETWNGTLYSVIYCSSGPALLDWDDNGNVRFIINFNIIRRSI
jgi:hypothetical protein